jgi:hypothetical protein
MRASRRSLQDVRHQGIDFLVMESWREGPHVLKDSGHP